MKGEFGILDDLLKYFKNKFIDISVNENNLIDSYSSLEEELNSVKYGVGIYNRSESAVIKLKGKDVLDFLQRISTNDVAKLLPSHYVSTLFTNEKGRLIDRTILVSTEDYYVLIGSKGNDNVLFRWINKYIITEDVNPENHTGNYLILDVIGPQAESYLTLICGKEVDDLDKNQLHQIEIDNTSSYLLKKTTASGLSMVGEKAFDYYRVINQVPKYPNEINDNFNPHEAGLMHDVNENKGCYIGQEVVARLDTYDKVQKRLKKVKINGLKDSTLPLELYHKDDEQIGILTTSVKVFENNHHEGLAFIKKSFQDKGCIEDVKSSSGDDKIKLKITS